MRLASATVLLVLALGPTAAAQELVLPPPPAPAVDRPEQLQGPAAQGPRLATNEATAYVGLGGSDLGVGATFGVQTDLWLGESAGVGIRLEGLGTGPFLGDGDELSAGHLQALGSARLGGPHVFFVAAGGIGAGAYDLVHHESCFLAFDDDCRETNTAIRAGAAFTYSANAGVRANLGHFTMALEWRTTGIADLTTLHTLTLALGGNWS